MLLILIIIVEVSNVGKKISLHLKLLFNETAMNYGASTHFNTLEYESYTINRSV